MFVPSFVPSLDFYPDDVSRISHQQPDFSYGKRSMMSPILIPPITTNNG
ncbi:MAG: hypothetical protein ABSD75_32820 [Terriglobales bacterium]